MSYTVFGHAAPVRAPAVVVVISHAYLSESFHVTVLTNVFFCEQAVHSSK